MRLMPTTILTPHDWLVDVRYVDWKGREKTRRVGVEPKVGGEEAALKAALESLKRRGELPPKIIDMTARRRTQVGIEKTISRDAELVKRFVKGND